MVKHQVGVKFLILHDKPLFHVHEAEVIAESIDEVFYLHHHFHHPLWLVPLFLRLVQINDVDEIKEIFTPERLHRASNLLVVRNRQRKVIDRMALRRIFVGLDMLL